MGILINSLVTSAIVLTLIGIIYKNLGDRIQDNHNNKVNRESCEITHKMVDNKFEILFEKINERFKKMDRQEELLTDIANDIKVIMKGINGNG